MSLVNVGAVGKVILSEEEMELIRMILILIL